MCGIAGFLTAHRDTAKALRDLRAMGDTIAHRGPDGKGEWFDPLGGIGLAHRRLAIVDLTPDGAQPMQSPCGRFIVVFNGEIYNYRELRTELEQSGIDFRWRGNSDTEVILASVVKWGFSRSLTKFNGMFAIAIWDALERKLFLARDRFGEKPLYYGWNNGSFLFGSELKALRAYPDWKGELDGESARRFLEFCYVPAPRSIYSGIYKLPPASWISITPDTVQNRVEVPQPYWALLDVIADARNTPPAGIESEIVSLVDSELRRAVALRMHADVPLGAFLSGGIDSSLVVAMMQAQTTRAVRTFSLGVSDSNYDESGYARAVATHIGTEHTEFIVTPKEMLAVVPKLAEMYDEPFADSSQIPTHLVACMARKHVTVALTGDGGDEIFGGYNRHVLARKLDTMMLLPRPFRQLAGSFLQLVSVGGWDRLNSIVAKLSGRSPSRILGHKLHKLARAIAAPSREHLYQQLVSFWLPSTAESVAQSDLLMGSSVAEFSFSEQMMAVDLMTYLPDDILTKVDRASMSVALEGRMPFLDPGVLALAWRIPIDVKIKGHMGKWILRKVLHRYVPPALVERPKSGFGIPVGTWLRGPLREWAESLLTKNALAKRAFIDTDRVRQAWTMHLSGQDGMEYDIWAVLMLQAWFENESGV